MKKRVLGLFLVLSLVFTSAMPAFAETTTISDKAEVQAAWEAYVDLKTALGGTDVAAVDSAFAAVEAANENLERDDVKVLVAADPDFWATLFQAGVVTRTDELYHAFLTDKNAKTAKDFVDYYGMEDVAEYKAVVAQFIPDVETVYAEAVAMMPSENVVKVYEAYVGLQNALNFWMVDDSTREAVAAFDAVADIFNELDDQEMADLAVLMGEESTEAAWNAVFAAVVDLNILVGIDDAYQAFNNNPTEETAQAFVDMYESVLPENPDDAMIDAELVRNFFMDIDATYAAAKEVLNPPADKEPAADTEDDGEKAPATGDSNTVIPFATLIAAGAALVALRRKSA